jgi:hypothetical protein
MHEFRYLHRGPAVSPLLEDVPVPPLRAGELLVRIAGPADARGHITATNVAIMTAMRICTR